MKKKLEGNFKEILGKVKRNKPPISPRRTAFLTATNRFTHRNEPPYSSQ